MIREIYIRDEKDPYFDPHIIEYSNETESIISQIRMILGTKKGQVFGDNDFGVDLEYMVFNTKSAAYEVKGRIDDQISRYVKHGDNIFIDSEVSFGDSGKGYDYAVIDIMINGVKTIGFLVDRES